MTDIDISSIPCTINFISYTENKLLASTHYKGCPPIPVKHSYVSIQKTSLNVNSRKVFKVWDVEFVYEISRFPYEVIVNIILIEETHNEI